MTESALYDALERAILPSASGDQFAALPGEVAHAEGPRAGVRRDPGGVDAARSRAAPRWRRCR